MYGSHGFLKGCASVAVVPGSNYGSKLHFIQVIVTKNGTISRAKNGRSCMY
jgi:hypothetical protein